MEVLHEKDPSSLKDIIPLLLKYLQVNLSTAEAILKQRVKAIFV